MSTLRVNTIQNASGGSAIDVPGAAKAWVNFNGTGTVAIRAALNVSSITDNGVGTYQVNFTNALADVNYSVVGTVSFSTTGDGGIWLEVFGTNNQTTTSSRVNSRAAGGYFDCAGVYVSFFR